MHHDAQGVSYRIVRSSALTAANWDEIWELTRTYFDTRREFTERQLRAHQNVVLFRTRPDRALVGMAAVNVYPVEFRGRKLVVIYTAHVLLHEPYRGLNLIQRVGFNFFLRARLRHPFRRAYWFFDTFSYKSYLLLPRNLQEFWPRYDQPMPEWERALMDKLATDAYGERWRPERGIVERSGEKRLLPEAAPLEWKLVGIPDLEFYARVNPEHADGDMLVCLSPLNAANWLSLAKRAIMRRRRPRE